MDTTKLKSKLEDKVRDLDTPAEAAPKPTVELAPLDSHYMAFRSNALTVIQENLKNQPLSFQFFDIVKSPSGGATVFSCAGAVRRGAGEGADGHHHGLHHTKGVLGHA